MNGDHARMRIRPLQAHIWISGARWMLVGLAALAFGIPGLLIAAAAALALAPRMLVITEQRVGYSVFWRWRTFALDEVTATRVTAQGLCIERGRAAIRFGLDMPYRARAAYMMDIVRRRQLVQEVMLGDEPCVKFVPSDRLEGFLLHRAGMNPEGLYCLAVFVVGVAALIVGRQFMAEVVGPSSLAIGSPVVLAFGLANHWRCLNGAVAMADDGLMLPEPLRAWSVYAGQQIDSCLPLSAHRWLCAVADRYFVIDLRRPNGPECLARIRGWLAELPWGAVTIEAMDAAGVGLPAKPGGAA